jgi:DNA-binding NarL/FixJ family response regulator
MNNIIRILINSGQNENCNRILTILSAQNEFHIAGIEKDETGTIIKSERLQPDILILDIQPQGMGGEELAPIIHRRSPSTVIIMLSDRDDENYARLAIKAGISGYLLKEKDTDILASVVKIVFSGGYFISASIINRFINTTAITNQFSEQESGQNYTLFSRAERSIVTDLAQGYSDTEIAKHLNFSKGTIKNYLVAIKNKLKLKNRIQIVVFALLFGLIRLENLDIWKNHRQLIKYRIK